MIYVLYFIHVVVSVFLILVVLLQQGKGADLSVFGGGSTQAAFGARGAATLLHKLTVTGFVVFTITTLAISLMQGRSLHGSVMDSSVVQQESSAPASTPPASETPAPAEQAPASQPDGGTAPSGT